MGSIAVFILQILLFGSTIFAYIKLKKVKKGLDQEFEDLALEEEILNERRELLLSQIEEFDKARDLINKKIVSNSRIMMTHNINLIRQYSLIKTEYHVNQDESLRDRCNQNIKILSEDLEALEKYYFALTGTHFSYPNTFDSFKDSN